MSARLAAHIIFFWPFLTSNLYDISDDIQLLTILTMGAFKPFHAKAGKYITLFNKTAQIALFFG